MCAVTFILAATVCACYNVHVYTVHPSMACTLPEKLLIPLPYYVLTLCMHVHVVMNMIVQLRTLDLYTMYTVYMYLYMYLLYTHTHTYTHTHIHTHMHTYTHTLAGTERVEEENTQEKVPEGCSGHYYVWKVRLVFLPWMDMYAGIKDVLRVKNDAIAAINS